MKDTKEKLSPLSIALHWIVGVFVIAMLALGLTMGKYELFFLYPIHKSVGILLFAVIVWRAGWRMVNGWPQPLGDYPNWQRRLARISHWTLLVGVLLMPLSGMLMSVLGGRGLAVFGVELLAANLNAAGKAVALHEPLAQLAHIVHHYTGRVLIAVVVLHACAALRHHFILKDNVLRRMLARR